MSDLFKHALDVVPEDEVSDTPLFLLATAGMRLLPDMQRKALLAEICTYAKKTTNFQLPDCDLHIQVISGETEGLYGWIAANYLVGGFDHQKNHMHGDNHHTYGFLDMGGASAQIAFAPNSTEAVKHANDLQLLRLRAVDGVQSEYRVFVTTWLGYGVNEARRRYTQALMDSVDLEMTQLLPDPCLPNGLEVKKDGTVINPGSEEAEGTEPYLLGTGRFPECLAQTLPLLDKNAACDDPPCLFHGVHVPAIDFHVNHFIGISEYWHTTHEIFEMGHADKAYDFLTYQTRVTEFCSQDWDAITKGITAESWGKKVDAERAAEVCFKASWIINILHEGIGVPRVGIETDKQPEGTNGTTAVLDAAAEEGYLAPFQAVNKVDDTEVSWTLGKMVLYAASQAPPANEDTLAVGFGSNTAGIPIDFQYAGGIPDPTSSIDLSSYSNLSDDLSDSDTNIASTSSSDWQTSLLSTSSLPRRIPGFILFLLILLLACFLLCGRDRRHTISHKLTSFFRRNNQTTRDGTFSNMRSKRSRGGGLSSKFPFSLGNNTHQKQKYERVLEEGDAEAFGIGMPRPEDFELNHVHSSSSDDEAASITSKNSLRAHSGQRHHSGRSSGTATPRRIRSISPSLFFNAGNGGGGYLDGSNGGGVGLGLALPSGHGGSFERSGGGGGGGSGNGGLLSRTESRERLDRMARGGGGGGGFEGLLGGSGNNNNGSLGGGGAGGGVGGTGTGHRSRAGSPTRWRSPLLMPLKENVD